VIRGPSRRYPATILTELSLFHLRLMLSLRMRGTLSPLPLTSSCPMLKYAQAFSRRLPTAASRFRSHLRSCLRNWYWRRFGPSTSVSPANSHSIDTSTIMIIVIVVRGGTVGQIEADVLSGHPPPPIKKHRDKFRVRYKESSVCIYVKHLQTRRRLNMTAMEFFWTQ
jgi:hypothetical protein